MRKSKIPVSVKTIPFTLTGSLIEPEGSTPIISQDCILIKGRSNSLVASQTEGGRSGSAGCFIATAAYGSMMEPHVRILRDFRDRYLLVNTAGKDFVCLYNTYSPPIADSIANHDSFRAMVRLGLLPFIGLSWLALKIDPVSTMALMLFFAFGLIGLVRAGKKFNR